MPTTLTVPRESVELVRLQVTVDGQPTTAYTVAVVAYGARPTNFTAPSTAGSHTGYLTGTLTAGDYGVWVKVDANPEHPVLFAARLLIN